MAVVLLVQIPFHVRLLNDFLFFSLTPSEFALLRGTCTCLCDGAKQFGKKYIFPSFWLKSSRQSILVF
ncbi:hypothetical protein VNO78_18747 [Psophocarpus tetragonolobus]|uniref:Uncharacterized protein n=1 Tax=Psophocarpus tetragonolobus TaxID=3891 RepID=A0AAN9S6W6_PSOTE